MAYYTNLGIETTATIGEIRAAYLKRVLEAHPDKPGGSNIKFQELFKAFQVLSDGARRAMYDKMCGNMCRQEGTTDCGGRGSTEDKDDFKVTTAPPSDLPGYHHAGSGLPHRSSRWRQSLPRGC